MASDPTTAESIAKGFWRGLGVAGGHPATWLLFGFSFAAIGEPGASMGCVVMAKLCVRDELRKVKPHG